MNNLTNIDIFMSCAVIVFYQLEYTVLLIVIDEKNVDIMFVDIYSLMPYSAS